MSISSAVGVNPDFHENQVSSNHAFRNKRFKALRVTADTLSSLVMSLFYKTLSLLCRIACQKTRADRYGDLASYYWNRAPNRSLAYAMYGNTVVNFATNSTGTPRNSSLEKVYGTLFEKMRKRVSSNHYPILKDKLSQYPINQGICLGASLDFISRYLRHDNKAELETIEKISKLFIEKGTPEAQITQILYSAQDIHQLLEKKTTNRETLLSDLNKKSDDFNKRLDERKKQFLAGIKNPKDLPKKLEALMVETQNEVSEMKRDTHRKIALMNSELDCERLQSLANANGIELRLNRVFIDEDTKQKTAPNAFKLEIDKLPLGAYLVLLRSASDSPGHAIAFIKTSEKETYLFDPNLATLKFDKAETFVFQLWGLTKKFYNTKGTCTMQVYNCNKLSDPKK